MPLETRPLSDFSLSQLAEIHNVAFQGYIVPFHINAEALGGMVRTGGVDLHASRLLMQDGEPAAVAMIARRGWSARLAGMAVYPHARGKGLGKSLVLRLLAETAQRGERRMVLEAFEQNEPAVKLYESVGFRVDRRLLGYKLAEPHGVHDPNLVECDPFEVARVAMREEDEELPWQLAASKLIYAGTPTKGFRLGPAFVAITDPTANAVSIRTLVVPRSDRRAGHATKLLQGLFARFPGKEWRLIPIIPEGLAPRFFQSLGFERDRLNQVEMSLNLVARQP